MFDASAVPEKKAAAPKPSPSKAERILKIAFPDGIPVNRLDEAIKLRDTVNQI